MNTKNIENKKYSESFNLTFVFFSLTRKCVAQKKCFTRFNPSNFRLNPNNQSFNELTNKFKWSKNRVFFYVSFSRIFNFILIYFDLILFNRIQFVYIIVVELWVRLSTVRKWNVLWNMIGIYSRVKQATDCCTCFS